MLSGCPVSGREEPAVIRIASIACAILLVLSAATRAVEAKDDLRSIRHVLKTNRDPKVRIAQIPKLVGIGTDDAAALLGFLVRHDRTLAVRIGAAEGLGRVNAPSAAGILIEQLLRGGPRVLREALSKSLGRAPGAGRLVLKALVDSGPGRLEQALLLDAMGALRDDSTHDRLGHYRVEADPTLRHASLRALAQRKDAVAERTTLLGRLLIQTQDLEYLRELLDVLEPALHGSMRPALKRLRLHAEADIAEAARMLHGHVPDHVPNPPQPLQQPVKPEGRYAKPGPPFRPTLEVPPPRPPKGRREDLVVAFDATGSARLLLPHVIRWVEREMSQFESSNASTRVGVIVFRGGRGRAARLKGIDVLPLTFDFDRVRDFLAEVEVHGTDDRGAAITEALRQGLDLMNWRWTATRRLRLFVDSDVDDLQESLRRIGDHYQADRTRTAITYFLRTRTHVPENLEVLARAGGHGGVDPLKSEPPRRRR